MKKVRIEATPWTEKFMLLYHSAMSGDAEKPARTPNRVQADTWSWLCHAYFSSSDFTGLDTSTQKRRRSALEATFIETIKPGSPLLWADCPIERITPVAIRSLRDRKAIDTPDGANARLKAIRGVFRWAVSPDVELVSSNPARDVPPIPIVTDGHHSWDLAEVRRYIKRHPIGSKAYLALCLLMFSGGRRSDAVLFGREHLQDGWLRYTQHKGRNSKPMKLEVPVVPALRAAIDAQPISNPTFLVTSFDKPFTSNGFGNWFKDRCVEADLPHCSAHGLRKAGATLAAHNGATERQLMAMFGWRTSAMAQLYTRAAEQKRLALAAMHLINFDQKEVPLEVILSSGLDFELEDAELSAA